MKLVEIKDKITPELTKLSAQLEDEIFQIKFKLGSGQLKQTSDVKKKRRALARVKTILRQRELQSV